MTFTTAITQPCQSATVSGPACQFTAAVALFGVHLCFHHEHYWRRKVGAGGKVKVHSERALPLDHNCSLDPTKVCPNCGRTWSVGMFSPDVRARRSVASWCKLCMQQYQRATTAAAKPSPPPPPPLTDRRRRPGRLCATEDCGNVAATASEWCLACELAGRTTDSEANRGEACRCLECREAA